MRKYELLTSEIRAELESTPLTVKQQRFIEEYLKVFNGSKAARRAGYSVKCAHQQAYENLRKPKIKKIIDRAIATWSRATLIAGGVIRPDEDLSELS